MKNGILFPAEFVANKPASIHLRAERRRRVSSSRAKSLSSLAEVGDEGRSKSVRIWIWFSSADGRRVSATAD